MAGFFLVMGEGAFYDPNWGEFLLQERRVVISSTRGFTVSASSAAV
jgi:hypothetical protein